MLNLLLRSFHMSGQGFQVSSNTRNGPQLEQQKTRSELWCFEDASAFMSALELQKHQSPAAKAAKAAIAQEKASKDDMSKATGLECDQ